MKLEHLKKLDKEGRLESALRKLKEIYQMWQKMKEKHRGIYANFLAEKPEAKETVAYILEKHEELTSKFEEDISQIEEYVTKRKNGEN